MNLIHRACACVSRKLLLKLLTQLTVELRWRLHKCVRDGQNMLKELGPPAAQLPSDHSRTTLALMLLSRRVGSILILDHEAPTCAAAWVPCLLPVLCHLKRKICAILFFNFCFTSLFQEVLSLELQQLGIHSVGISFLVHAL